MPTVSLRVPVDMHERLDRLARESGRTKTHYILMLLDEHLAELEDLAIAEAALAEMRRTGEKGIPLEEVMAQHGLRSRAVGKGREGAQPARSRGRKSASK